MKHEKEKKRAYEQRVREVEHTSFVPLVMSVTGGMSREATIHKIEHLSDAEKLAYLKDALKDGPARNVIQGLTQMASTYNKAIKCLQDWFNHPSLIQRAHV